MRVLVTGSTGHLGEGLVRELQAAGHEPIGLDLLPSPFTSQVGSISDREVVRQAMRGVNAVIHPATLHKPHVATHTRQQFVDSNITGTLTLLEEAVAAGVSCFLFTSTTSTFGRALSPEPPAPAIWVTEEVRPQPKNIYGVTKLAAEDLCQLFYQDHGLPCLVLRTSRFFPEEDDRKEVRQAYDDTNLKVNELLFRRVDLADAVEAHLLALERAPAIGFRKYIISATSPFIRDDLDDLSRNAPAVVKRYVPGYEEEYCRRGWHMFPEIQRVYSNERARAELGWQPRYDFARAIELLRQEQEVRSPLARTVGAKFYHRERFTDGPYPVLND